MPINEKVADINFLSRADLVAGGRGEGGGGVLGGVGLPDPPQRFDTLTNQRSPSVIFYDIHFDRQP